MGRRRLVTILTVATVGVALPAHAASAQLSGLPGVGDVVDGVLGEDCVDIDDLSLSQLAGLDPDDCVVDGDTLLDTPDVIADAAAEVAKRAAGTAKDATDAASGVTRSTTETVRDAVGGSGGTPPTPGGGSSDGGDEAGAPAGGGGPAAGGDATTAPANEPVSAVPQRRAPTEAELRQRRADLDGVRALRSELAAADALQRGVAGPVVPFGGLSTTDLDLAAPQVADAGVTRDLYQQPVTPEVAPEADTEDAIFATTGPLPERDQTPLALRLLAAVLVLGSATVWVMARRELNDGGAIF